MVLPHDDVGAGPDVVLLHAGVADRGMWSDLLDPVADAGFRVVALDLPGFGEARGAGSPDGPWADVVETMDELAIDDAAVVGVSYGGMVAQRLAYVSPDRVSALVLVSTPVPGHSFSAELIAAQSREEAAFEDEDLDGAVAAVLDTWTRPDMPDVRSRVETMQRRAYELQSRAEDADPDDPLDEDPAPLAKIVAPTLVINGNLDWDDFRTAGDALVQVLPDARQITLQGAGHLAPLERPDDFREALISFLRT